MKITLLESNKKKKTGFPEKDSISLLKDSIFLLKDSISVLKAIFDNKH